ncbi:MAG: VWA domain-containing protein [Xanthomonadales bacterium]|nr:VWA domain-containing protein [Xanthomonadales bacterium]
MSLMWPWLLLTMPLPWLLGRWRRRADVEGPAPFWPYGTQVGAIQLDARATRVRMPWLHTLAWAAVCLAAARPVTWSEARQPPVSGRELMLAVDVSGSMAADDMEIAGRRVDRLGAVKAVVGDFLARRAGDRVGLILFGQQAYLLTPLTFDHSSVAYQLNTSTVGIAGRETAIGDAIGLAVKRMRDSAASQRVLILLTDGVNTAGALTPEQATQLASDLGLRIHTIGIGSNEPSRQGMFGLLLPSPPAEIDEAGLQRIAQQTGGRYFRARDATELAAIYAELDRLEAVETEGEVHRLRVEWFWAPLLLALLGLAIRRHRSERPA